jgi:hypothetical protein
MAGFPWCRFTVVPVSRGAGFPWCRFPVVPVSNRHGKTGTTIVPAGQRRRKGTCDEGGRAGWKPAPRKKEEAVTPVDVREQLVQALGVDLVGPDRDSELLEEILPQPPSRWYLTGFLVPIDAEEDQKTDEIGDEAVDAGGDAFGDDAGPPEPASARRASFPSSLGLSFLLPLGAETLQVTARWGDYQPETATPEGGEPEEDGAVSRNDVPWKRTHREQTISLSLPPPGKPLEQAPMPRLGRDTGTKDTIKSLTSAFEAASQARVAPR